jgi:hypothetical protein
LLCDDAIVASSIYDKNYKSFNARLKKAGSSCSWAPADKGHSWLQVDLEQLSIVKGIATQGTCHDEDEWVMSYSVSYSSDGGDWTSYQESGNEKASTGLKLILTIRFELIILSLKRRCVPFE